MENDNPDPLNLPILPTYAEGTYLLLLPGLDKDELRDWTYEYDDDQNLLIVKCYYGGINSDGQIDGVVYPVEVSGHDLDKMDQLKSLLLKNPLKIDLENYFDPDEAEQMKEFFEQLESKYAR